MCKRNTLIGTVLALEALTACNGSVEHAAPAHKTLLEQDVARLGTQTLNIFNCLPKNVIGHSTGTTSTGEAIDIPFYSPPYKNQLLAPYDLSVEKDGGRIRSILLEEHTDKRQAFVELTFDGPGMGRAEYKENALDTDHKLNAAQYSKLDSDRSEQIFNDIANDVLAKPAYAHCGDAVIILS